MKDDLATHADGQLDPPVDNTTELTELQIVKAEATGTQSEVSCGQIALDSADSKPIKEDAEHRGAGHIVLSGGAPPACPSQPPAVNQERPGGIGKMMVHVALDEERLGDISKMMLDAARLARERSGGISKMMLDAARLDRERSGGISKMMLDEARLDQERFGGISKVMLVAARLDRERSGGIGKMMLDAARLDQDRRGISALMMEAIKRDWDHTRGLTGVASALAELMGRDQGRWAAFRDDLSKGIVSSIGTAQSMNSLLKSWSGLQTDIASAVSAFRLPEARDFVGSFAGIDKHLEAGSALSILDRDDLRQKLSAFQTCWVDSTRPSRSIAAMATLTAIGKAINEAPYGGPTVGLLRHTLGDWRGLSNPLPLTGSWRRRNNFYREFGFDRRLTSFPEPVFSEALLQTEILGPGPLLPPGEEAGEEADLGVQDRVFKRRLLATYELIIETEDTLRRYIQSMITKAVGTDWERTRIPSEMRISWEDKRQKAVAKGRSEMALVYYADFTDYVKIICRNDNWKDVFGTAFRNKKDIEVSFERLQVMRIETMHVRPISKSDVLLVGVEARRLLRAMQGLDD